MKKILGLDLGVASIGWAFIHENDEKTALNEIIATGVRIIPLDTKTEKDEFAKGGNVGTNVARRKFRGARRNQQRYRLRRGDLLNALKLSGLLPEKKTYLLSPADLFSLRAKALTEKLSPGEIGRVLLHLNNRRGFKSNRKSEEKEESNYKEAIKARELKLTTASETIGQYFAENLSAHPDFRVKQEIFNRSTYQEEFDLIWASQARFYPAVLNETTRKKIRDKIIYYQRPLRSQKGLVGECALEWNYAIDKQTKDFVLLANGQRKVVRPKCAPKSSPLAQECKVWESIHNIRITDETGVYYEMSNAEKKLIFNTLQDKKELTATALLKLLNLTPSKYTPDALIREKKLQGNHTRVKLLETFQKFAIQRRDILVFQPVIEEAEAVNFEHGNKFSRLQLRADFDKEPLYQLWHLIYATEDENDLIRLLQERYQFTSEQAAGVAAIDFSAAGFTNKSSRAMRRLLPHLQTGKDYTNACVQSGYNHSNSITSAENDARQLLEKLEILPKNSLRNPVVEKVLNQMIHLVNAILQDTTMGKPDEIRVELARELKQSAKERKGIFNKQNQRERDRKDIRKRVSEMLKIQPESVTKVQIEKWQLWHEVNGISLYSGKKTELSSFLRGEGVDIEHIIPKSRCFDDSFENKTICETRFNQDKDKQTARDFMESQPVEGLQNIDAYLRRVNDLERMGKSGGKEGEGISRSKYNRLMMEAKGIPDDFISRQLRETQYIAKKAKQILVDICFNVYASSGSVTDFLRHQWGCYEAIEQTRLPQFRDAGKTDIILIKRGQQQKETIPGWTKRLDHRHHALDALTVACTKQAFIQRLNHLNQTYDQLKGANRRDALRSHGQKTIANHENAPFSTTTVINAMDQILISFRQGSNVASPSRNKVAGQKTLTPRGPLHEETIYGRTRFYKTVDLNGRFDAKWLNEMVHPHQKELVQTRLDLFGNDPKRAFKDLDKKPISYGNKQEKSLKKVTIWNYTYVSRKSVDVTLTEKQVEKIADPAVKAALQKRLADGGGNPKESFKNIGIDPVFAGGPFPVKRVRVKNPAEKMIALPRGYAEPGSNHHIAIYKDGNGKKQEHVVTFWDAFQRMRLGIPAIIKDTKAAYGLIENAEDGKFPDDFYLPGYDWEFITSLQSNDMFVFGLDPKEVDFRAAKNQKMVSKALFRVRKLSSGNYWFMHHLETEILEDTESKALGRCKQCSPSSLEGERGIKVKLNRLGKVTQTGE